MIRNYHLGNYFGDCCVIILNLYKLLNDITIAFFRIHKIYDLTINKLNVINIIYIFFLLYSYYLINFNASCNPTSNASS